MHPQLIDTFGTPDSMEWRHRRHVVRANGHPTGDGDRYLVWDRADELVAECPSLRAAGHWIDSQTV